MSYYYEKISENNGLPAKFMLSQCTDLTIPAHWHDYLEVLYMMEGELTAVVQAGSYLLTPGNLMIINSKELHMTRANGSVCYILLQISAEHLHNFLPSGTELHFQTMIAPADNGEVFSGLRQSLEHMLDAYTRQDNGYQFFFAAKLYEFLYHLYRNFCTLSPSAPETGANRDLERVTQVMDWVRNHFQKPLTLDDAAASLAVSREYFCRLFKRYTGQTFLEYLNSVRTMHLYEDLKNTDDSITVLMEKTASVTTKVFMRTFKKLYGDTPQKIRSEIREYFSPELPS